MRMRTLERDPRDYPIPFIVWRDRRGQPHFTINDHTKVAACLSKKLCSICGKRLDVDMWFVGGSRALLHDDGALIDPPLHYDCAIYALQVCPFLAAMNYTKSIGARKLPDLPDDLRITSIEYSGPPQPERFGLGCTRAYRKQSFDSASRFVLKIDQWDYMEWWRNGTRCPAPDANRVNEIRREHGKVMDCLNG
jgi:hypothetical protein